MTDSNASVVPAEDAPARKRPGLGIASLVLAIVAVLGDILTIVIAVSSFTSFDESLGAGFGLLAVFLGVGLIALFGGLVVAIVALVLAIAALVTGRGRIPAVFGLILSLGVVVSHGILVATLAAGGSALTTGLGG